MADKKGSTEIDKKHQEQDKKNEEGMNHALANARTAGGSRKPMWGGMQMAPGNKRVATKLPKS